MALEIAATVASYKGGREMADFVVNVVSETAMDVGLSQTEVSAPWKNTVLGLWMASLAEGKGAEYSTESKQAVALGVAAISIFDKLAEQGLPVNVEDILEKCGNWLRMAPETLQRYARIQNPENTAQTLFQYYAEAIVAEEAYKKGLKEQTHGDKSVWNKYLAVSTESNSIPMLFALYAESVGESQEIQSNWVLWRDMSYVLRVLTDLRDSAGIAEDLHKDWGNVAIVYAKFGSDVGSLVEARKELLQRVDAKHKEILGQGTGKSKTRKFVQRYYKNLFNVLKVMGKLSGVGKGLKELDRELAADGDNEP